VGSLLEADPDRALDVVDGEEIGSALLAHDLTCLGMICIRRGEMQIDEQAAGSALQLARVERVPATGRTVGKYEIRFEFASGSFEGKARREKLESQKTSRKNAELRR
jgi:hypothetical protein